MAHLKEIVGAVALTLILSSTATAAVVNVSQSTEGKRYARVNDQTGGTAVAPGYQTTSTGELYFPRIMLNNAGGDISNATGTPAINISRATGDISGTSGINNTIRDNIGQGQVTGQWIRLGWNWWKDKYSRYTYTVTLPADAKDFFVYARNAGATIVPVEWAKKQYTDRGVAVNDSTGLTHGVLMRALGGNTYRLKAYNNKWLYDIDMYYRR